MSNSNQSNFQNLQQMLAGAQGGRKNKKRVHLYGKPVVPDSDFSIEQHTYVDPQSGEIVTEELSSAVILACGCCVNSPKDIHVCPGCSTLSRGGKWRRPQLICRKHPLCIRCRQKRLRDLQGGGPLRRLLRGIFKIILWPFFDVYEE